MPMTRMISNDSLMKKNSQCMLILAALTSMLSLLLSVGSVLLVLRSGRQLLLLELRQAGLEKTIFPGDRSHMFRAGRRRYERDAGADDLLGNFYDNSGQVEGLQSPVEFVRPAYLEDDDKGSDEARTWMSTTGRGLPLEVIKEFCGAAKDYCPNLKGATGLPGLPGIKGSRGRAGRLGPKGASGHRGPVGSPGPRGQKGDKGAQGPPGLDGRDGLPGEPGLDGVPGRNGFDGLRGNDGIPGLPGSPGVPGTNGKDGKTGDKGDRGPRGPQGERGLPGPRGRAGKNGKDGVRGEPGISLWTTVGTSNTDDEENDDNADAGGENRNSVILIPPSISGGGPDGKGKRIVATEGDHLKLTCLASGIPEPVISWSRADGVVFPDGVWRKSNDLGPTLTLSRVNREHMGVYRCDADNGIPPADNALFNLEVQFSPLITINQRMVGAYVGGSVILECLSEAFPHPKNHWERYDGLVIRESWEEKFVMSERRVGLYGHLMSLNVTLTSSNDFGMYNCISENSQGQAEGGVHIYESKPGSAIPPPLLEGGSTPLVFGSRPPPFASVESLCPAPSQITAANKCDKKCEKVKCEMFDRSKITIKPYEPSLTKLKNRTAECSIQAVGKPVLQREAAAAAAVASSSDSTGAAASDSAGAWMMEAYGVTGSHSGPRNHPRHPEKKIIWETSSSERGVLREFSVASRFAAKVPERNYTLPIHFDGNDHVVYNRTFFYYSAVKEGIVSYELDTGRAKVLHIPRNAENEAKEGAALLKGLYSSEHDMSFVDFSTDENGLWATMGLALNNHTLIAKLTASTLQPEYMWEMSIDPNSLVESFITCGVWYAVERARDGAMEISLAIDLYRNHVTHLHVPFADAYGQMTMLNYNPRLPILTSWDGGRQLTYPLKFSATDTVDHSETSYNAYGAVANSAEKAGLSAL